jgi:hypothetical protein
MSEQRPPRTTAFRRRSSHTARTPLRQHPTRPYRPHLRNFRNPLGFLCLYENNSPQECYHCLGGNGSSLLSLHYPSSQAFSFAIGCNDDR